MLLYRGYPIEQLAEKSNFLEVCYLLLNGELPNEAQRKEFELGVMRHTMLHEQLRTFYNGFRRDAHPMAVMCGVVGALSAFYHDSLDIHDPESRRISAFRLIAKVPTIAAWAHKYAVGQPFMYPRNDLGYAENFLTCSTPCRRSSTRSIRCCRRAMDLIMILHADHEQNASTSTVRLAGSTGANPFACIAAGIASLWGPAHGGANEAVLKMLAEIGHVKNIPHFLEDVKDRNNHAKLMGFGHRVYKNYDPRAKIIQKACHDVLQELGIKDDPLLDLAMELEKIALNDKYFVDRKLYPNVDFYSGIILKAMGFPTSMFTALFAVSRTVGWVSQWQEMMEDPAAAHRPAAADLHRCTAARLRAARPPRLTTGRRAKRPDWRVCRCQSIDFGKQNLSAAPGPVDIFIHRLLINHASNNGQVHGPGMDLSHGRGHLGTQGRCMVAIATYEALSRSC